jgi:murein L,D-transpeptidase YcbB/YkuD
MALPSKKSSDCRTVPPLARLVAATLLGLLSAQAPCAGDVEVRNALRAASEQLPEAAQIGGYRPGAPGRLAAFYRRHDYRPQWSDRRRIDALLVAIHGSARHGLRPDDYVPALIGKSPAGPDDPADRLAFVDIVATDNLIRLAHDLRYGKTNPEIAVDRPADHGIADEDVVLRAASIADAIDSLAPQTSQYGRLMAALDDYRARADWPSVSAGPTIRPGDRGPRVAELRRRLLASGDLAAVTAPIVADLYDEGLQGAVRRFQVRHGLAGDALVGRATLRALNVPVDARIDQLRVNLERLRREARDRNEDEVLVNAAAFEARLIRDDDIEWRTRAVVGDPENQTPPICATLTHIVFNPTWTVPYSIASEEMLPSIKRDPRFFERGGYRLLDAEGVQLDPSAIDWLSLNENNFPYTIEQQPGPLNQLGRIKFVFPNESSVYMHDTPARQLFDRPTRALSHGCVRIDEPLAFAANVLDGEGWSPSDIDAQLDSFDTSTVTLLRPLPVRLVYRTAEVDGDGTLYFFEDIYERDAEVLGKLHRPLH